jgi:hypothetical protein
MKPQKAKNKMKRKTSPSQQGEDNDQGKSSLTAKLREGAVAYNKNRAQLLFFAWTIAKLEALGLTYDDWKAQGRPLSALGVSKADALAEIRAFFDVPSAYIEEVLTVWR